jgi:hypothetical protein
METVWCVNGNVKQELSGKESAEYSVLVEWVWFIMTPYYSEQNHQHSQLFNTT